MMERSSKLLTVTITGAPSPTAPLSFYAGSALSIVVVGRAGRAISDDFKSITVDFKGTSGVQSDGELASFHPVAQESVSIDVVSGRGSLTLPAWNSCPCQEGAKVALPSSVSVVHTQGGHREGQESGLVVTYTLEVLARKNRVGKVERLSFPVTILSPNLLGPSILSVPSLKAAEDAWAALGDWVWRSIRVVDFNPSLRDLISSADLFYHLTSFDNGCARVRWRLHLVPGPSHRPDDLLPFLGEEKVSVFLAHKVVPILPARHGGGEGAGKAYKTILDEESRSPARVGDGMAKVSGWISLPAKSIGIRKSCNGELQHFLIASITPIPPSWQPLNVNIQLHRPSSQHIPSITSSLPSTPFPSLEATVSGKLPLSTTAEVRKELALTSSPFPSFDAIVAGNISPSTIADDRKEPESPPPPQAQAPIAVTLAQPTFKVALEHKIPEVELKAVKKRPSILHFHWKR